MAAEPGYVQFSIGRVIGDSFGVFARNFVSFFILAMLIGAINLLVALYYLDDLQVQLQNPEQIDFAGFWTSLGVSGLVALIVSSLTQAAIIYGTFQDLRGQKASIGDCIVRGLTSIIPVLIGSVLWSLGVGIGNLLLIIPGIILALMWWVYIPAIVVEGQGIFGSFGRSRELTRGRRWQILGLLIVVVVLYVVVGLLVDLITSAVAAGMTPSAASITGVLVQYGITSLVTAFSAILAAVGYYYLRAEKEGVDVNEIAQVFD